MITRRRRLNNTWILVIVLIITSIITLYILRAYLRNIQFDKSERFEGQFRGPSPYRHVTKSMSQLRAGALVPELSDHVLFFNRVPKTGSEMLVLLLQWLQGINGFRHVRLGGGNTRRLGTGEQESLVDKVTQMIREEAVPMTFDRHVYFLNFTQFGHQSPVFMNLVRDPVDKAVSRFYYRRVTPNPRGVDLSFAPKRTTPLLKTNTFEHCLESRDSECSFVDGEPYDLSIPYFCGHEPWCMLLNDGRALQKAKDNVERYFSVVGVLEELNATLSVLENRLPRFFRNVQDIYYNELLQPHRNKNRKRPKDLSSSIRTYLRSNLKTEYEFYNWIRSRLLKQYANNM